MDNLAQRSTTAVIGLGVVAIIFGILALFWPIGSALTLVIFWGAYALVDGITSIVLAFRSDEGRGWLVVSGVIGILAGLVAMFQPLSSAVALTWVLGIWLIARAIMELIAAIGAKTTGPRWLTFLSALLWAIAGTLFVLNPGASALGLAMWLGVLAITWGIVLVVLGFSARNAAKTTA